MKKLIGVILITFVASAVNWSDTERMVDDTVNWSDPKPIKTTRWNDETIQDENFGGTYAQRYKDKKNVPLVIVKFEEV